MNKRIKKKKKKQEQERIIRLIIEDPDLLKKALKSVAEVAKTISENIHKLIDEILEMSEKMKTEFFVGEEVIADGHDTEIIAIAYDECGEKVYMVDGSMKDYYFNELRRVHKC